MNVLGSTIQRSNLAHFLHKEWSSWKNTSSQYFPHVQWQILDTRQQKLKVHLESDRSLIPQMLSNGLMVTSLNACAPRNSHMVHRSWKKNVKQLKQLSPRDASSIEGILRRRGGLCI
jgi:hypothetical protein